MPGKFMIYGQLQYYLYELKAWSRITGFHKTEVHELVTQLHILLSFPLVSLPDTMAANSLVDKLMVHQKRFGYVHDHVEEQMQRLTHAVLDPDKLDPTVVSAQEGCRTKMRAYEAAFVKARYECLVFLSVFFHPSDALLK